MKFTTYPSGSVLCYAKHGDGAVMFLCCDADLSPQEKQEKARREVQGMLDKLTDDSLTTQLA
jgi:hypothetical protein